MAQTGFAVENYRETMRALARADRQSKKAFRDEFRKVGESHPIETTGRELRKLMAWVKSHDSDYVEGTSTRA